MTTILDHIDKPQDLHGLSEDELQQVAQEVRELLIDTVGEIGGHFGANLGACEIAVAVHSLLDSPRDKVIWDVGHQAYPHKVLTGRRDQLQTIRKYHGLAPFCSIAESEHDIMGAGHASTAIGYAVGLKEAMRHGQGPDGKVVAVVGDGAMTGGVAFEAVHQAGGLGTPIVVILNDNGMSIAPNVGALSRYFNRVRLDPGLWKAREGVEEKLTRLPGGIGARFERLGPQVKESVKALWQPGLWWEELDWAYMGVIDGHDVRAVRKAMSAAFEAERPVVIHVATVKGKGFAPAEEGGLEGMEKWHAAKPKSIEHRRPAPSKPKTSVAPPQYTQVFGEAMVRECERDERVVGITAAMNSGTGLSILQKAMPDRYFDVGIAEQQAVLFAAGLALQGMRPVAAIYSHLPAARVRPDRPRRLPAEPQRDVQHGPRRPGRRRRPHASRRVRHRLPAAAAQHHADGPARRGDARPHAPHRAADRRPGSDPLSARRGGGRRDPARADRARARHRRDPARGRAGGDRRLRQRRRQGARRGRRCWPTTGSTSRSPTRASPSRSTPACWRSSRPSTTCVVTVEEGVLMGGFGSAVWESLSDGGAAPRMLRVGLPDRYVTHGAPKLLHEEVGFTPERIAERIEAAVLDPRGSLRLDRSSLAVRLVVHALSQPSSSLARALHRSPTRMTRTPLDQLPEPTRRGDLVARTARRSSSRGPVPAGSPSVHA